MQILYQIKQKCREMKWNGILAYCFKTAVILTFELEGALCVRKAIITNHFSFVTDPKVVLIMPPPFLHTHEVNFECEDLK